VALHVSLLLVGHGLGALKLTENCPEAFVLELKLPLTVFCPEEKENVFPVIGMRTLGSKVTDPLTSQPPLDS
jgi:hypothetical protein